MPCIRVDVPGGGTALVKTGKPRAPQCHFCRKDSTALCDAVRGKTLGGDKIECSTPICDRHRVRAGGKDFCPRHSF